jgi:hypothetical protein
LPESSGGDDDDDEDGVSAAPLIPLKFMNFKELRRAQWVKLLFFSIPLQNSLLFVSAHEKLIEKVPSMFSWHEREREKFNEEIHALLTPLVHQSHNQIIIINYTRAHTQRCRTSVF